MSKQIINQYLKAKAKGEKVSVPRVSFSQILLDWLPFQDFDYEVIDQKQTYLRCRIRGKTKSLVVVKRASGGGMKRVKICNVGDLPLTAPAPKNGAEQKPSVSSKYQSIVSTLNDGEIPTKKKATTASDTLADVFKAYVKDSVAADATLDNYRRAMDVHLFDWKDKPLINIDQDKVKERFLKIAKGSTNKDGRKIGGQVAANTAMKLVGALFNLKGETDSKFPASPTKILNQGKSKRKKKATWHKPAARTGRIEASQLKAWWDATEALTEQYKGDGDLARDYLQFILLTGMRRREATSLDWKDINDKQLTVRSTKNGTDHALPVTPALKTILDRRKAVKGKPFPVTEPRRFMAWVTKQSDVEFTIHDLRRTFAGYCEHQCEMPEKTISALLNHTKTDSITGDYIGEMELAKLSTKLQLVQDYIKRVVSDSPTPTQLEDARNGN